MKTEYMKLDRLILLLGIALVASGVVAGATYLNFERKMRSDEALAATLDRLYQNQQLSSVLKLMYDGDTETAARHLDLLLCHELRLVKSQLGAADDRTRLSVKDAFARIALIRPKSLPTAAGAPQELYNLYQIEAEKILMEACAGGTSANKGVAALR